MEKSNRMTGVHDRLRFSLATVARPSLRTVNGVHKGQLLYSIRLRKILLLLDWKPQNSSRLPNIHEIYQNWSILIKYVHFFFHLCVHS